MSSQRKAIALNTTSYYLINFSDYIISLILLPFLARTILIEGVGILGLAQTLGIVCVLIMEFGFSLSATREIASSDNNENHSLVVSRVISSKIFLILPCLALCLLTFIFLPTFNDKPQLIILTFISAVFNGFTPLWFFQGIQKVFPFAILKVAFRLLSIFPLLAFVRSPSDIWIVLFSQSVASFFICLISLKWLFSKTSFTFVKLKNVKRFLSKDWHTFSITIVPPLCTMLVFYYLSLKLPIESIGLINSAERIFKACISLFGPLGQVIYPFIVSELSHDRLKATYQTIKAFWLYLILGLLISLTVYAFSDPFINWYLGDDFRDSAKILQLFALSIPVVKVSHILGRQWMLSIKLDNVVNMAVIFSGLVLFVALFISINFSQIFSFPISYLTSEIFLMLFFVFYLHFKKLGFWNN